MLVLAAVRNTETGWSGRGSTFEWGDLESWMFHRSLGSREEEGFQDMGSAPDAAKVKCDKGWKVLVCF